MDGNTNGSEGEKRMLGQAFNISGDTVGNVFFIDQVEHHTTLHDGILDQEISHSIVPIDGRSFVIVHTGEAECLESRFPYQDGYSLQAHVEQHSSIFAA